MAEERKCPHCGERVYATDDVCMSCGKSLAPAAQPPAPQQPPAAPQPPAQPPTPAPAPRPPSSAGLPVTERIVGSVGGFWNIFPWLALAFSVLPYLMQFGVLQLPETLALAVMIPLGIFSGLIGLGLIFWVIVDVINQQAGIFWIPISICCSPIGLILYLLIGRQ